MSIRIHPIKAFNDNYIWTLINENNKQAIVIDPGQAAAPVIRAAGICADIQQPADKLRKPGPAEHAHGRDRRAPDRAPGQPVEAGRLWPPDRGR